MMTAINGAAEISTDHCARSVGCAGKQRLQPIELVVIQCSNRGEEIHCGDLTKLYALGGVEIDVSVPVHRADWYDQGQRRQNANSDQDKSEQGQRRANQRVWFGDAAGKI
jgi:hypothetical protein